ncbi:MAG: hypothetical protein ABSD74_14735 [Rhizomicrobium sp.]|jgi:hypothetical protein
MSVDGTWNITIDSPMGAQKVTLTLKSSGNTLTGTASGAQGTQEIIDGKVDGNAVSWKTAITQPMPMSLEFSGVVDGDKISGNVKAGSFGTFKFSGTRG